MGLLSNRVNNLITLIDTYMALGGQHLNINVMDRQRLIDAQRDKYSTLVVRVSGYAIKFNRLTKEQQDEVIARMIHDRM